MYRTQMNKIDMETPKSSGSTAVPRRLSVTSSHYISEPMICSPLATSSPMVFNNAILSSADRPNRRPPPTPSSTTNRLQQINYSQINIENPQQALIDDARRRAAAAAAGSQTNTIRSADLSSLFTRPDEAAFETRHSNLLQSIQNQRELVEQAAAAIAFCRKKYSNNGTLQELSAQRLLLISQERLLLFNRQMDQLKDMRFSSNFVNQSQLDNIPEIRDFEQDNENEIEIGRVETESHLMTSNVFRTTLYIDKFVIRLNPSFSMKKIDKESTYAFVILCRYSDYIHATQVANVLDVGELRNNKVKIKELIVFDDLPPDFCVLVEVFAMKIGKRWDHKWQSMWDFATRALRNMKRTFIPSSSSTSADNVINSKNNNKYKDQVVTAGASFSASSMLSQQPSILFSEFRRCGYLHLNRESLGTNKDKFYLSDADYPLEGSIEVFSRSSVNNASLEPPRPDSADLDLRIGGGTIVHCG